MSETTNDIAKNLISILESMNMKSTADSFKFEFTSKNKQNIFLIFYQSLKNNVEKKLLVIVIVIFM